VIETRDRGSTLPLVKAEKDYFPCLFVLTGSGVDYIQVNADGTFTLLDGSGRGGMSFLGLGSLLTGAQSFEQLVKLAEAGNPKNVDIYSDAFDQDGGATADDSMYSKTLAGQASPIFAFGKCVGTKLGDLKKEDVARALLDLFVADIIQTTMTVSSAGGLRRACLGGNFITSKLVRDLMIEQMDRRNLYYSITGKPTIGIDFLQSSAHIGAIGALVIHYEKHSTKL
jgi:type II pantothenate kinase